MQIQIFTPFHPSRFEEISAKKICLTPYSLAKENFVHAFSKGIRFCDRVLIILTGLVFVVPLLNTILYLFLHNWTAKSSSKDLRQIHDQTDDKLQLTKESWDEFISNFAKKFPLLTENLDFEFTHDEIKTEMESLQLKINQATSHEKKLELFATLCNYLSEKLTIIADSEPKSKYLIFLFNMKFFIHALRENCTLIRNNAKSLSESHDALIRSLFAGLPDTQWGPIWLEGKTLIQTLTTAYENVINPSEHPMNHPIDDVQYRTLPVKQVLNRTLNVLAYWTSMTFISSWHRCPKE